VTARAPARLPVKLRCAAEERGWGRLESLTPSRARLVTLCEIHRHETIELSFELFGERVEDAAARVDYRSRDEDGFWTADVDFLDPLLKRRLAKTLADVLSR